jgi:polyhydroxybutyrate depolymerase
MIFFKYILLSIFFIVSFIVKAQTELTDSINHQGLYRKYIIHLPPSYDGNNKLPLIMVLHGGGNGDATSPRDKLHYDEIGDTADFITVFPYGYYNDWADGRGVTSDDTAGIDDVSFLISLKDTLFNQYEIDSCKAFLVGASNGGMMTLRIASEQPKSFSAYASIISSLPNLVANNFSPNSSISILFMSGTSDPLIPYNGGSLSPITSGGTVIGVDSTISLMLTNNGCTNVVPDSTYLPDVDLTDNSTVVKYNYGFCNDSSEIVLYKIVGGGHADPGLEVAINPIPLLGYINYDIDGAIEVWNFFNRHSKSTCSTSGILSVNDIIFKLYPNPVKETLVIQPQREYSTMKVSFYNVMGQNILTTQNKEVINVKNLPKGIYYLKIEIDTIMQVAKIIK